MAISSSVDARPLAIIIVGASGNLARKKIFPALFSLYCQGSLPRPFGVYGLSRTQFTHDEFRAHIAGNLTCRYTPPAHCATRMDEFLSRCFYQPGEYGQPDAILRILNLRQGTLTEGETDVLWYLAIPPSLFAPTIQAIGSAKAVDCDSRKPWTRVVIEKPFGRDRESFDILDRSIAGVFCEERIFRIDHYLGKEMVQNLLALRFGNAIFEHLWHRRLISHVHILWKEDMDLEGRGSYFDNYGIVRDVMQNHLLQVLALLAMAPPRRMNAGELQRARARILSAVRPVAPADMVIGQYGRGQRRGQDMPAYREEPHVAADSHTSTYAAAVLHIDHPCWRGVPFFLEAGKGMDCRLSQVRICFKPSRRDLFAADHAEANEILIAIQPQEAIKLRILTKKRGLEFSLAARDLDLVYETAFAGHVMPDAYECLLHEVIATGDRTFFLSREEAAAAWDIFTPVLRHIEGESLPPEIYPFGSATVPGGERLKMKYGIR